MFMKIFLKIRYYKCCITKDISKELIQAKELLTDLAKSNKSKECMICQYWFFNQGFKFQGLVCNGCHDLKILS